MFTYFFNDQNQADTLEMNDFGDYPNPEAADHQFTGLFTRADTAAYA
jgi:hypothetical protein